METTNLVRRGGLAALVAGVIGVLFAPLYALSYFRTTDGMDSLAEEPPLLPWHDVLGPVLEPLLTFASPETVYFTYAKLWLVVALGWLAGTLALHAWQSTRAGRLEQWGFRIVVVALSLLTVGFIGGAYVGHLVPAAQNLSFLGFVVPGLALLLVGWPLFGVGTLRAGVAPKVGAWLLTLGWFPGFVVLTVVLGQLTAATLLLQVAWIVLGHAMWSRSGVRPAERATLVGPAQAA